LEGVGRVNDTKHSLLTMSGGTTVEEGCVGVINDLSEDEASVLFTGSEGSIGGLVAGSQFGALGDGVFVGTPHELDGVSDRGVYSERNVTEDTLSWCDDDGNRAASTDASRVLTAY